MSKIFSQADTIKLFYEIDKFSLTEEHKLIIEEKLQTLGDPRLNVRIMGSADYLGKEDANRILSDNRVKTVGDYISTNYGSAIQNIIFDSQGEKAKPDGIKKDPRIGVQDHRIVKIIFEIPINKPTTAKLEDLAGLNKGEKIILQNLNFQPGRHILLKESIPILKKLLKILHDNPDLKIEIQGHICCFDNETKPDGMDLDTGEYKLSLNRAINIYNYLVRKGIDSTRLSYKGFGFTKPLIYPEKSSEDQIQNRRVELKRM